MIAALTDWGRADEMLWRLFRNGETDAAAVDIAERASILQYDAGMDRVSAERLAQITHVHNGGHK